MGEGRKSCGMNTRPVLSRRQFVKTSTGLAASMALVASQRVWGANDRVVFGFMGVGGRGSYLLQALAKRSDVEVAYVCDVDTRRFANAREAVEEAQGRAPKTTQDFRRILEDKSVDVLVNATPDHWHALGTILACQAGKDVYVEKPLAHNPWEGRQMVAAARKYQRVVQVGTQSRSASYLREAAEAIRAGKLGEVQLVRVFNMMEHPRRKPGTTQPVPAGLDYGLWCGPAPLMPYDPGRRWLDQWEFSCGAIAGDAVHQLDLARYLIGDMPYPDTVVQAGGVNVLKDGREIPDTQIATFEYGKLTLVLDGALWAPYMKKTPMAVRDTDEMPNWPFNATRIEVLGTRGMMYYGRHGDGWQVFGPDAESAHTGVGRQSDAEHQDNFIACVKSRKQPTSDVEQGHYSTLLCHLANISYRVGNRKLAWDAKTESFRDAPDANAYLRRTYRAPWIVPETV